MYRAVTHMNHSCGSYEPQLWLIWATAVARMWLISWGSYGMAHMYRGWMECTWLIHIYDKYMAHMCDIYVADIMWRIWHGSYTSSLDIPTMENSDSSLQIQIGPKSPFEFVLQDTEESAFSVFLDIGGQFEGFSVESVVSELSSKCDRWARCHEWANECKSACCE